MHPFFDVTKPIVIGHRGAAGECPENTLLSFETALAQGAQILESDIHVSRDGVPILLHDPTLERTTDGQGDASRFDWEELRLLDAAEHHRDERGETPLRGTGIRIASLQDAFEAFPAARFNLEIKSRDPRAIGATLELLRRFERDDRTLLAAGENDIMQELRLALRAHVVRPALGACLGEIVQAIQAAISNAPMPVDVMALQVPPTALGKPLVTRAFIDHAHRHDVQVHVWTINDLEEIETLVDLGVDGVVTDYPGRMHDWIERRD